MTKVSPHLGSLNTNGRNPAPLDGDIFNMDIIIVTDDTRGKDNQLLVEAGIVKAALHYVMGIKSILVTGLVDSDGLKHVLKSRKVVFLFCLQRDVNNELKDTWLNKIRENNGPGSLKCFVACVGDIFLVRTIEDRIEGFQHYCAKTFNWFPTVLEGFFGRSGVVTDMPTIEDLSDDKNKSRIVINAVINMLAHFGIYGSRQTSSDRILLFWDGKLSENDMTRLRDSKLAGTMIHALNIAHDKVDSSLNWISNWNWTANTVHSFIMVVMIEMQLINVDKQLVMKEKVQACPVTSSIKFQKKSGDCITLTWEAVKSTDTRIVVKQSSEANMEWNVTARRIDGFESNCYAGGLKKGKKYQFSLTAEGVDETTEPVLSDWVSIEKKKSKFVLVEKTLLALFWILALPLNIVQCCLILVVALCVLALIIAISSFGCLKDIMGTDKYDQCSSSPKNYAVVVALCFYCLVLIVYAVVPWFVFEQNSIFSLVYIVPLAYLLFWSIIGNIVCSYVFKLEYGVLSLQCTILDVIGAVGVDLHQYTAESIVKDHSDFTYTCSI